MASLFPLNYLIYYSSLWAGELPPFLLTKPPMSCIREKHGHIGAPHGILALQMRELPRSACRVASYSHCFIQKATIHCSLCIRPKKGIGKKRTTAFKWCKHTVPFKIITLTQE